MCALWLSDSLQGKYRGLEKAARIYNVAIEQPLYFRLVILELMENLTSGDQQIRRNSLWMLSKIVEEHRDYGFMSPTIQILISSLRDKNSAIRYFTLKIVNQVTRAYYEQFKGALTNIVSNLRDSSSKIKALASAIITQFIEVDSNAMESAIGLLIQALKDKDLEIREVAIKALFHIDKHVDKVVQAIMESFHDESFRVNMTRHILEFIKRNPESVINGLRNTVMNSDDKIRENSIMFLHQIAESKHVDELSTVVPELLKALNDKNKIVHRTAIRILYLISKIKAQVLYRGISKFIQLLKIKNKLLLSYIIYILVQLLKFFPDELSEHVNSLLKILEKSLEWEDVEPKIEVINTISHCMLLQYENQFAQALNLAQNCVRQYTFEKTIVELHLFIGYVQYYLGNYSDSIQAFLQSEDAHKRGDYYTACLVNIMVAFNFSLLRLFKSCMDYQKDAEKLFELTKDRISSTQIQKLQFLIDFIGAIANHNFKMAQSTLLSYHALEPVKHPVEQKFRVIDFENVKKAEKFYQDSQKILAEIKKTNDEEEPPVLDD